MTRALLITLFAVLAGNVSRAATMDLITVNTSSLPPGTKGFIDLAFNGAFPATATVSSFSMAGGSLDSSAIQTFGTVTGQLPGTVTLAQNDADYDEGITFGSSLQFVLTLSGTPGGNVGDVFTLSFFNADFSGGLLTGNVNDLWLVQFQMDTKGSVTGTAYANPNGGPSFASIQPVPEPSSLLFLAGLLGAAGCYCGRSRVNSKCVGSSPRDFSMARHSARLSPTASIRRRGSVSGL